MLVAIRPNDLRPSVDFSGHVRMRWLVPMVFFKSWPLDWDYWARGKRGWWTYDEPLEYALHRNIEKKIIWEREGTWESNPGPSTYHANALPAEPLTRFVYNITNNQYNVKQWLVGYFRAKFKRTTRIMPHDLLLHSFAFLPEKTN